MEKSTKVVLVGVAAVIAYLLFKNKIKSPAPIPTPSPAPAPPIIPSLEPKVIIDPTPIPPPPPIEPIIVVEPTPTPTPTNIFSISNTIINILSASVTYNSIRFNWTPSTPKNIVGYNIYVNDSLFQTVDASVNIFDITNLQSDTSYLISVEAFDEKGNKSQVGNATITTSVSPIFNLKIVLESNSTSTSGTNLLWIPDSLTSIAGFEIYKNGVLLATKQADSSSKYSLPISGLSSGTNYMFYVKAYDSEGNKSPLSNTITVSTLVPPPPPPAPVVYTGPRDIEVRARNDSFEASVPLAYSKNRGPIISLGNVTNKYCGKHAMVNAQDGDVLTFYVAEPRKIAGAMSPTCPLVILGRNSSADGRFTDVTVKNGYIQLALTIE